MLKNSILSPSIRAGELCHRVSFSHASATQDSFGQPINTWTPYLTTRARIENLSGQQLFQAQEFTSQAIWRITIRWPGAGVVQTGDRAFFEAHTFVVQIVNNMLERGRVLQLTCLEIDGSS
jgi:SPP1 family predicted phage head-tail adaptor